MGGGRTVGVIGGEGVSNGEGDDGVEDVGDEG